jgi:ABC-2 type transport system permease protein
MNGLAAAVSVEFLKARRSRVPWGIGAGFSLFPIVGGFFMLILKDPERARQLGLLGAKAQLTAGTADWPTFVGLISQACAIGGAMLFAFLFAWLFGREFADRTVRDLVASPTSRSAIVIAKVAVGSAWSLAIVAWVLAFAFAIGLAIDALVGLPGWSGEVVLRGFAGAAAAAVMTISLQSFTAFFAGVGRGYIPGLGWAVLAIFLAQIVAALGWGAWFPWSVPALVSGMAGPDAEAVSLGGVLIVAFTAVLGLVATVLWWNRADQTG